MKKYNIILIIAAVFLQFSCNKNLDPKVYSNLTSTNAFHTQSDAVAAVNAVYARLKGPAVGDNFDYWTVRHFALTDLTTDVGHCDYGGDPGQLSLVQWNSANGLLAEDWRQIYKLIADANNAIYNLSAMTTIGNDAKSQFLAEMKFLRAIAYLDLTDAWGPVVLVTEKDLANPKYTNQPPVTPVATIDALLISDLEGAISTLPVDYQNNKYYSTNDVGRATKGAAMTLLAKLYLRQHQWQKAADLTKQVMDLGIYQLYPTYAGLFKEDNKWCSENIFSVLSDANVNGTELLNHFGPLNHPVLTDRWQYYAVTWDFYNSYGDEDDRKKMFFTEYDGVDGLTHKEAPTLGATPPAGVLYMPDVATMKYADPSRADNTYYDGHSVDILRYADVLLSRAEALNELSGPSAESIGLVNMVKARSHAKQLVLGELNQSTFRDALLQERGWELYYEGKRRADLMRFGKYDVVVNAYLKRAGLNQTVTLPRDQYFPYPINQVNINPNLNNSGRQ
ncbi:RagB/SusD family nutrient uptake outer membrane protein [Mucilaginibacter flavidus]|uniref:RagB/SusD family nutrient uptake outer membrane protein n=1 Tax=Mucilaginibacter flavidus TaxID=2949309 RepID=UPI0020924A05|nr:RagB/SusD family nutrient uptake outer membrane protein [Mucilaginibacter flavidus]MCO5950220.1 RagB/SusD family nutrient uptake outer membrane protein [Mucilaginibacter flavidus]